MVAATTTTKIAACRTPTVVMEVVSHKSRVWKCVWLSVVCILFRSREIAIVNVFVVVFLPTKIFTQRIIRFTNISQGGVRFKWEPATERGYKGVVYFWVRVGTRVTLNFFLVFKLNDNSKYCLNFSKNRLSLMGQKMSRKGHFDKEEEQEKRHWTINFPFGFSRCPPGYFENNAVILFYCTQTSFMSSSYFFLYAHALKLSALPPCCYMSCWRYCCYRC